MQVKCKRSCTGVGYHNFKTEEIREVKKEIADKLIKFGYIEILEIESAKPKKKSNKKPTKKEVVQ